MRIVIERVKSAKLTVSGELISEIGKGLIVLVGVCKGDTSGNVTAKDPEVTEDQYYTVITGPGVLTVRAVEEDQATAVKPVQTAPTTASEGSAVAVVPAGTTYTLNNTGVPLPDDHGASLLFDSIIDDTTANRTQMLEEKADDFLGGADENRQYEIKYLDLVDANNGNAWIKASGDVTIYWGYPQGTNSSTTFQVLHFKDLHRDNSNGGSSGFNPDDIAGSEIETVPNVSKTDYGISFSVEPGGFSPFALVYETKDSSTDPGTDPGDDEEDDDDDRPTTGGNHDSDYTLYYHSNFGDDKTFYQSDDDRTMEVRDYEDMSRLPDREGYEFVGWNTEEDGSGDDYAPGDEFRMTERRAHLYAMWERVLPDPDDTGVSRWLNTDDHDAYLSGYPDNTFGPDRSMTRAEVAQMFYALLLDKDVPVTVTFSDVPADAWYAEAVNTLASLGMVEGYADGTFRPDNTITRAEFVTIAVGFADLEIDGEARFTDVARNAWYYPYIADACAYGRIGGHRYWSFRPDNTITRAEVTVIVNNMLGRAADERYVDRHEDELRQFGDLTEAHWAWYPIAEAVNSHDYTGSGANERWR